VIGNLQPRGNIQCLRGAQTESELAKRCSALHGGLGGHLHRSGGAIDRVRRASNHIGTPVSCTIGKGASASLPARDASERAHANQLQAPAAQEPRTAEVDRILRKCVHCGLYTAICPTYVTLGDERDSPRGRIYLMKEMFLVAGVRRLDRRRRIGIRHHASSHLQGRYFFVRLGDHSVTARGTHPLTTPDVFLKANNTIDLHSIRAGVNVSFWNRCPRSAKASPLRRQRAAALVPTGYGHMPRGIRRQAAR
jgi:hypothetical protein